MIRLHLTNESFEQDIRPLIKSFFSKEELLVSFGETLGKEQVTASVGRPDSKMADAGKNGQ